jgi:5'-3' exonuclease
MAAEQIPGGYRSIALVDLSYLFKKNYMAQARDAKPGEASQLTLDQLAGIRESVEHVIICCDAPPYRRKDIYPEYKAQRERPDDAEISQKRWLMDRIDKAGYCIAKAKGYEADDVIYTLCKRYWWCEDVRIIAGDKDCAQCVTDTCRMFVPAVGQRPAEIRGPAEIEAKYGVAPKDMGLWLALVGDSSDNIPGVPGIGPKKAAQLIKDCRSLTGIAEALATSGDGAKPAAMWRALADHWDQLVASSKLTVLEEAPVDASALLEKKQPQPLVTDEGDEETDMQSNHQTPQAEWEGQRAAERAKPLKTEPPRVTEAEFDPISRAPENYVAPKPTAPAAQQPERKSEPPRAAAPAAPPPPSTAIVRESHGVVSTDLQPQDLQSARSISKWIHNGQLYPQFPNPEAVFTIILRGKELGLSVTTALAGFHMVEGKPTASADLIRSLAERDVKCEYFRLVESSTKKAKWATKHRDHDAATEYEYTIEEAEAAGLLRPSRSGKPSNWVTRPRDMLTKTAASKLARIVYPGATLGLYCPEEMDQ